MTTHALVTKLKPLLPLNNCVRTRLNPITDKLTPMAFRQFSRASDLEVIHDDKSKTFYIPLGSDSTIRAVLDYELLNGKKVMDMNHTEVPVELRGRGIAKQLAVAAFDFASSQGLRVLPTCSYIQKFVEETDNQVYKDCVK